MMQSLVFSASGLSFILLVYLVIRCVASPLPVLRSRRRLFPKRPIGVSAVSAGTKTSSFVTTSTERTQAATGGRSEEPRGGQEWGRTWKYGWVSHHSKKKKKHNK